MKPLIILASNSYHEVQAFGIYHNKKVAEVAQQKFENRYPTWDFLILTIDPGYMTASKDNKPAKGQARKRAS